MKHTHLIGITVGFLILVSAPFVWATWAGYPNQVFGGFILNPMDGQTYLAKMYHGWLGHWKAVLPYTADAGSGAYLFIYYGFLGHIARWFNLGLPLVFDLARIAGAGLLVICLARFYWRLFGDSGKTIQALLLVVFGSGIGWLALPFGQITSDFWVAEAYPFLSSMVNPHFPLSLALILWLLTDLDNAGSLGGGVINLTTSFLLALIQPFGIIIVLMVLGGKAAWDGWETRRLAWKKPLWVLLGGAPVLFYQFWVTRSSPIWENWTAQNLTLAPPAWDLILALSPALVLAVAGLVGVIRQRDKAGRLLVCWMVFSILLVYFPFNLQRRFMLGLFIPVAGLAVFGVHQWMAARPGRLGWLPKALFFSSIITNLIILTGAAIAIQTLQPTLYISRGEANALAWIKENTPQDALVLAGADTGLRIPANTGRRVIYGHPFETVNAVAEKQLVEDFFSGKMDGAQASQMITARQVDFVLGPPRKCAGKAPPAGNAARGLPGGWCDNL
jgi:hypothetical protein